MADILWSWNGNDNDFGDGSDEFESDRSDDYLEDDDNDDDEEDDLDKNEFVSSDVVSESGDIPIIEVKHKWETKPYKAEEITSPTLSISDTVSLIDIFKEEKKHSKRHSVMQRTY